MDAAFSLEEGARASFLQYFVHTLGCTYICLWFYLPHPSNCLTLLDGFFREEDNNQPSSSSGSLARRLFDQYCKSIFILDKNEGVPGLAFKNNSPFLEVKEMDLQRMASLHIQSLFYQEARIKTAIFMGCKNGEIELGMPNLPQMDIEMEMKAWFPREFSRPPLHEQAPQPPNQNWPSSSSTSSLGSSSIDSTDQSSSIIFNLPISQVHAASSSLRPSLPPLPFYYGTYPQQVSAFKKYNEPITAAASSSGSALRSGRESGIRRDRQSMMKRAITFFRNLELSLRASQAQMQPQATRPTATGTRLHHMMSERKRRENLSKSFQALKMLLPPGTKRDKASVLAGTMEHLSSLKAQVQQLTRKNQRLEEQVFGGREAAPAAAAGVFNAGGGGGSFSGERLNVRIENMESTSEGRSFSLRVIVRGGCSLLELTTRVLEFLKRVGNMSMVSVEAESTRMEETGLHISRVMLGLKVEGDEWDEAAFKEAVRRVVADFGH